MSVPFETRPAIGRHWRLMIVVSLGLHAALLTVPGLRVPRTPPAALPVQLDVRLQAGRDRTSGVPARTVVPDAPLRHLPARAAPAAPGTTVARPVTPRLPAPDLPSSVATPLPAAVDTPPPTSAVPEPGPPASRTGADAPSAKPPALGQALAPGGAVSAGIRGRTIAEIAHELESADAKARQEGAGERRIHPSVGDVFRDRMARPDAYREIPLKEGGTMIQMPDGRCMVTSGPRDAFHPFESKLVMFTSPQMDARCPR